MLATKWRTVYRRARRERGRPVRSLLGVFRRGLGLGQGGDGVGGGNVKPSRCIVSPSQEFLLLFSTTG